MIGKLRTVVAGLVALFLVAGFITVAPTEADAAPEPFVSDDFSGGSLDPARWTVVDPLGDATVSVTGAGTSDARLSIAVAAGPDHELYGNTTAAPRVLQNVADTDFQVEARFNSQPTARYQMQGLFVQSDANDWLRVELLGNNNKVYAYVARTTNGSSSTVAYTEIPASASSSVRLTRTGSTYTVATAGNDPATFTNRASFNWSQPVTAMGPYAGNSSTNGTTAPAFTALVDYVFNTASPISPEDPTTTVNHTLTTNVVGSGTITPASGTYPTGTNVTLTATPAPGWTFTGWSGHTTSTTNPLTITITANTTLTATFTPDTTAPTISQVDATWSGSDVVISWNTSEPSTGAVDHGLTAAYGNTVADNALSTSHSVALPGYSAGQVVHYRLHATDASGNHSQTSGSSFTVPATSAPVLDVWYGADQSFGQLGAPQKWVNILGNVSDPQGVASLRYRLNGGSWKNLTVGADGRRLLSPGDFNAEIDHDVLVSGTNTVELEAVDSSGNAATKLVTVEWTDGVAPPPSFSSNWASASAVTDRAQPVDGHWELVPGGVRPSDVGYDRLLSLGDLGWVDYDLTTTVTVHEIDAAGAAANPNSGTPALWFVAGWQGHSPLNANDPSQPYWYYWPSGAFLGYGYTSGGDPRVIAIGNENGPQDADYSLGALQLETPYKVRVQAISEGAGVRYRMKIWLGSNPEPATWTVDILEDSGPDSGGMAISLHHIDATIGDITVVPVP
jgi:uncharacterized repeat protein (TIGR02543 family)